MKYPLAIAFLYVVIAVPRMDAKAAEGISPREKFSNLNNMLRRDDIAKECHAYSAYDLAWQSLHMAAAAACAGRTPTGGSGAYVNTVLARNSHGEKTCKQLCEENNTPYCDAEASIFGRVGKATTNGKVVATFYNYGCDRRAQGYGRNEASADEDDVMDISSKGAYSFCCCRK